MYFGLGDPQLYLSGLLFLLATFLSWFVPGWVTLSQLSWKNLSLKLVLALPVGLALWGAQGYIFGYLGIRLLTFAYLFSFTLLFLREQRRSGWKEFKKLFGLLNRKTLWLLALIAVSSFIQVYAHIGSGLRAAEGIAFYFVNSVDGVMHLAYIQELAQRFPPQEPGATGLPLQNYHYWSDLVLADLNRVWGLPIIHLFFQFAPLLISFWSMSLVVQFIRYLGGNNKTLIVALFLFTFGGDAAYLITLVLHGTWAEGVASLDSGATFYFNIPQVFARFVFLGSVLLLLEWWKQRKWIIGVIAAVLIASLFGFKVYYALYAVTGFCSVVAFEVLRTFVQYLRKHSLLKSFQYTLRQQRANLILVALLAFLCMSIYLPTNSGAGGLRYSYFEWPRRLLSAENIDYADWFLRMQVYEAAGNTRNIIVLNAWAVFLTFVAVYGTRIVGMFPLFRSQGQSWLRILILFVPANLLFILLGLYTLQTSGGLNVFNFLIVPILSFNIIGAFSLSKLPTKIFIPIFVLLVLLTLPRSSLQLQSFVQRYLKGDADLVVTHEELAAFAYLKQSTEETAVVQGLLTDSQNRLSLYIPFFSGRDAYIAGVSMLNSHNQPTEERIEKLEFALYESVPSSQSAALQSLGIQYLYVPTEQASGFSFPVVFQNQTSTILKIPRQ